MKKYLQIYGESIVKNIHIAESYDHVLVIPAYCEGAPFIGNLLQFSKIVDEQSLCIVVVNEPNEASMDAKEKNLALIESIKCLGSVKQHDSFALIRLKNIDILVLGPIVIDKKMGVGRARKIGGDLALSLIADGKVNCPIIYVTDADAELPQNYFERPKNIGCDDKNIACFIYPFIHVPPEDIKQKLSIELYSHRLNQYVEGLLWAGSPYAFHTIGSTLAIDAHAYAKVRGFPKIAAAEDFYLLNKLRKVGTIRNLVGAPIKLSARLSTRVPFGTGPALNKILQFADVFDAKIFYHPAVFNHVRWLLSNLNYIFDASMEKFDGNYADDLVHPSLVETSFFSLKGASQIKKHLAQRKTKSDFLKGFHDWFDAFKTLKFINALCNAGLFMQSYNNLTANGRNW